MNELFEISIIGIALSLLIVPLAFIFVVFFPAKIKVKRIVQIVATVILVFATSGFSIIWIISYWWGAFDGQDALLRFVYFLPLYVIGLWIINLIIFSKDMFTRKNPEVLS